MEAAEEEPDDENFEESAQLEEEEPDSELPEDADEEDELSESEEETGEIAYCQTHSTIKLAGGVEKKPCRLLFLSKGG